ncbi:MAG: Abi family protein [Oscillospiraceae bacterium]|nr:Abi family protein [Oscillospiraceae bacterium]
MNKVFSTTNSQLRKLRSRGLIIRDGSRVKKIIELENYYNLINGYKDLFLDKTYVGDDEQYIEGTDFNEIYALYMADRELRNLFLRYILEIENNIKSVIAHKFSEQYGYDNYLTVKNFDIFPKPKERKTNAQKIGEVSELIAHLQHEIARQLSKNNSMVSHYMLEYGYVPMWVLVNTLTLGTISKFYSVMKQKDQNNVGKQFGLKSDELQSILFVLSVYRNACAHDERLYNLKSVNQNLRPNMIKTSSVHDSLKIPRDASNNPVCGKNDLFAVVIIFKIMLAKNEFNKFYYALKKNIDDLSKQLNVISIDAVLKEMGFPDNWQDIKKI